VATTSGRRRRENHSDCNVVKGRWDGKALNIIECAISKQAFINGQ